MKIKFEFELGESEMLTLLLPLTGFIHTVLSRTANDSVGAKEPVADAEFEELDGENATEDEVEEAQPEVVVTTTPEPEAATEAAPPKRTRKRRTKAEIEAAKAEEAQDAEATTPQEPEADVASEPEVDSTDDSPKPSTEASDALSAALGHQAQVKFPSPNDFLRASYEQDKEKARKVCGEFIEEKDKPTLADLAPDELQELCHRMVDAGFKPEV